VTAPTDGEQRKITRGLRSLAAIFARLATHQQRPQFSHVIISTWDVGPALQRVFGSGDLAMSIVLVFATMVSLSALGLLVACEDK
jgi:hypothetical protein